MSWDDISKWQAMTKDELVEVLKHKHGCDDPIFERLKFIYVNNCYELSGSAHQYWPKEYFRMLWSYKHGLSDKGKWGF